MRIFSLLMYIALFNSCEKYDAKSTLGDPSQFDKISTGVDLIPNLMTKVGTVLPTPGSNPFLPFADEKHFFLAEPQPSNYCGSGSMPDWFRLNWMPYEIFKLIADNTTWDPDTDCWGVENIRNNLELTEYLWTILTQASSGTSSGTIFAGINYTATLNDVSTGSFTYNDNLSPGINVSGVTYTSRRLATISVEGGAETYTFELAWRVNNSTEYNVVMGISGGDEKTIISVSYNSTTGAISLEKNTVTNISNSSNSGSFYMKVSGNEQTSEFTVEYFSLGSSKGLSIYLVGNSSESSSSNHYVARVKQDTSDNDPSDRNNYYFCINAGVTDSNLNTFFNNNSADSFASMGTGLYGDELNVANTFAIDTDLNSTLDLSTEYADCHNGSYATTAENATMPSSTLVSTDESLYLVDTIIP